MTGRAVDHGPVQDRGVPADPRRRAGRAAGQRGVRGPLRGRRPRGPGRRPCPARRRCSGPAATPASASAWPPASPPATRDAIIAQLGWGELIDLALSPADAGRGRPWPDLPLTALLRLGGGAVSELAVAGDTASDVESGLRAGAGIVAGRADRGRFPRGPGEGRRAAHPRYDHRPPPLHHRVSAASGRRARAGRSPDGFGGSADLDRRARGQRGRLRARPGRPAPRRRRTAGRRPWSPSRGTSWW